MRRCLLQWAPGGRGASAAGSGGIAVREVSAAAVTAPLTVRCARGMRDELVDDVRARRYICDTARALAGQNGFCEVATPLIEQDTLFVRSLGSDTEVVAKELYRIADGDAHLALRPEGTAGVLRALVEGNHDGQLPVRWCYEGDMFRRERPQKGRYRQFRQFGVELFCARTDAARVAADAELVALAHLTLQRLLGPALATSVALRINSLGDAASRKAFTAKLREYCEAHRRNLSADSVARLDRGSVLRILDSKDENDQKVRGFLARLVVRLLTAARVQLLRESGPRLSDSLSSEALHYRQCVFDTLRKLDIAFEHDDGLVRGLDYYEHTVFEFVLPQSAVLGASQATVLAGGRYDQLTGLFRSAPFGAAGWAMGVDRLALLMPPASGGRAFVVVVASTLPEADVWRALEVAQHCRASSVASVQLLVGSNWGKLTQRAHDRHADVTVFIGPDEARAGTYTVRNMHTGLQLSATSLLQLSAAIEGAAARK